MADSGRGVQVENQAAHNVEYEDTAQQLYNQQLCLMISYLLYSVVVTLGCIVVSVLEANMVWSLIVLGSFAVAGILGVIASGVFLHGHVSKGASTRNALTVVILAFMAGVLALIISLYFVAVLCVASYGVAEIASGEAAEREDPEGAQAAEAALITIAILAGAAILFIFPFLVMSSLVAKHFIIIIQMLPRHSAAPITEEML